MNSIDSITQSLGALYRRYGYSRYKMSKFEEYDTYANNKDFLISDRVITFTDVSGKLLAMKPDVTISIIKNTDDTDGLLHKMYYNENVYRVSPASHGFKEIMQMGLECIGTTDFYNICEVIMLAAKSLETISSDYVLDVSHMGLVSAVISDAGFSGSEIKTVLNAISEKNAPELTALCRAKSLPCDAEDRLLMLVNIYGSAELVAEKLDILAVNDEAKRAIEDLKLVAEVFSKAEASDKLRIDFSVVNDMNYYNGIVFQGYIDGIPTGILSGGQYDRLMEKMGKKAQALGFALYLDFLEILDKCPSDYDTDILIEYDDSVTALEVFMETRKLTDMGNKVLALKDIPKNLRYKEKISLSKKGGTI